MSPRLTKTQQRLIAAQDMWNQPVGMGEAARMIGAREHTFYEWNKRGLLPDPEWPVSGRPAWRALVVYLWAVWTERVPRSSALLDTAGLDCSCPRCAYADPEYEHDETCKSADIVKRIADATAKHRDVRHGNVSVRVS